MESFLGFFIHYLPIIIQWIVAIIFLLLACLFALMIFGKPKKKQEGELSLEDVGALESRLKEIIESSIKLPLNAQPVEMPAEQVTQEVKSINRTSMEKMMQELSQKNAEIELLKQANIEASASASADVGDISSYLEKIRDLEGRLAEYEIIEEDIADLSLFKEENTKLKRELEALKGSNNPGAESLESNSKQSQDEATTVEKSSGDEPAPVSVQADKQDDLVAEFAAVVDQLEDKVTDENSTREEAEPTVERDTNEDIEEATAELTADLEILNQSLEKKETKPAPKEDDILAEFTKSLTQTEPTNKKIDNKKETPTKTSFVEETDPADFDKEDGSVDTDKMLAEMAGFGAMGGEGPESALEGDVDTDKMAAEATKLLSSE